MQQTMQSSQTNELRELTASEVEDVAGALKIQLGGVTIRVGYGAMLLDVAAAGLGGVSVWSDGAVCVHGPEQSNGSSSGVCTM